MRFPGLSYANVMSTVAVVLAMSGTAVAATQISGSTIKDRTIGHKKLVLNTVTGAEVNERTLSRVPNADKLDGKDSSAYVQGSRVSVLHAARSLQGDNTQTISVLSLPGLGTLGVTCVTTGDHFEWIFTNTSGVTVHGSAVTDDMTEHAGLHWATIAGSGPGTTMYFDHNNSQGFDDAPFFTQLLLKTGDQKKTADIRIGGSTKVGGAQTCEFSADALLY